VAFRSSTAEELTRQCSQNKNDIEEIYKQGKETNAKVDRLTTEVGDLKTRVGTLETRVGTLETKVDTLATRVDSRFDQVDSRFDRADTRFDRADARFDQVDARFDQADKRFDQVEKRFDRLERLLTQSPVVDPSSPLDFLPPEHEQSLRLLESKMNLYSRHTRDHSEELERLRQLNAAHDVRFDALDGQMAEVLSILRSKPA
jgi:chromosome segregation ATPase